MQILFPAGVPGAEAVFEKLARDLTAQFGGVTSYVRAPAEGRWRTGADTERDDIAVIEIMVERLDRRYWRELRARLEKELSQREIIIRVQDIDVL